MAAKCKRLFRITAISLLVYVTFRYLLPLVAPFLAAAVTAIVLKPSASWMAGRLQFSWRGKKRQISIGVIGILELVLLLTAGGILLYYGGKRLFQQLQLLADHLPVWVHRLDVGLTGACRRMEVTFSLKEDTMVRTAREMLVNLVDTAKQGAVPYLMENSMSILYRCVSVGVLLLVFLIGVVLFLQEWEQWQERLCQSVFQEEWNRLSRMLHLVANAYIRTQGLIILLTACICTVGLGFIGNPYSILIGIGIGLLDALPVFGTGTILLPWALALFLARRWGYGLLIVGLYVLCYLVREYVETKMMGDKVGLSPLETLISIYVGLQLFGIMGVVLGPVGVLIVKEFA